MNRLLFSIAKLLRDEPGQPRRERAAAFFFLLTWLVDLLMIAGGLAASVYIREYLAVDLKITRSPETGFVLLFFPYVLAYYWFSLFVAFKYSDVYRDRRFLGGNSEAGRITRSIFAFTLCNALLSFLLPTMFLPSRLTLGLSFLFCTLFVLLGRNAVTFLREALRGKGLDTKIALVMGTGAVAQAVCEELLNTTRHGYRLVGLLDGEGKKGRLGALKIFGGYERLERVVKRLKVDEIFLCEPEWDAGKILPVFSRLRPLETRIRLASPLFNVVIERVKVPVDSVGGVPILDFGGGVGSGWRGRVKRLIDLAVSLAVILVLSPLWLLIALCILLESGLPILFKQKRVGGAAGFSTATSSARWW